MSTAIVPASYEVSLVATPDQDDDVLEVSPFDDYREAGSFIFRRLHRWDQRTRRRPLPGLP